MEIVVDFLVDDVAEICVNLRHFLRNHPEHLVDQVDAPVIEHAAALVHKDMPVMHIAVEAVQLGLHDVEIAEFSGIVHIFRGAEIHVETSLLMDGEGHAGLFAGCFHLVKIFQ